MKVYAIDGKALMRSVKKGCQIRGEAMSTLPDSSASALREFTRRGTAIYDWRCSAIRAATSLPRRIESASTDSRDVLKNIHPKKETGMSI